MLLPYQDSLVVGMISDCAPCSLGLISVTTFEFVFECWEFDSFYKLSHGSGAFLF